MKAETPSIKLDAQKKPEINTDGLRSRPNALPDEPSFGPEPVKFGKEIDVRNLGSELRSSKGLIQTELQYGQQQVWKKFGEHFKEFGLSHSKEGMQQYLKIAEEIYKNPAIKHTFSQGGYYAGETWLINNGMLLRLDPQGNFRSLYMLK